MNKLGRFTIQSFIGPFLMSFAIILFILVMQFLAGYMEQIANKGLEGMVLLRLFYYAGARLLVTAMPVAVLAAALMTFGKMGESYELAAIKSCGVSVFRLMIPLIGVAMLLTGFGLWFSFSVIPKANLKFFSLLYDVQRKKADIMIQPGQFYYDIDEYVIRVADKNKITGTLFDVRLYDLSEHRGNVNVVLADSAQMNMVDNGHVLEMVLYQGHRYEDYKNEKGGSKTYPYGTTTFDSLKYKFNLSGFDLSRTDEGLFAGHQVTLARSELGYTVDSLMSRDTATIAKYRNYVFPYIKVDTSILSAVNDTVKTDSLSLAPFADNETAIERFSDWNTVEALNRALNNARSVKSYSEFIVGRRADQARKLRKYQQEWYFMHSLPMHCIVFMLLGLSLGAIIRKGGLGYPALISIFFFTVFYMLLSQGKKLGKEGVLDPMIGSSLSLIVLLPVAVFLTYQVSTDARLVNESFWTMVRDRFRGLFIRKKSKKK